MEGEFGSPIMVIPFGISQRVEIGGTLVILNILDLPGETSIQKWKIRQKSVPIIRKSGLNWDVALEDS